MNYNWIQYSLLSILLIISVSKVYSVWTLVDIYVALIVFFIIIVSFVSCLISKTKIYITIADIIIIIWWLFESCLTYLNHGITTYKEFILFSEFVFLYLGLRLLFTLRSTDKLIIPLFILLGCLYECALGGYQIITSTSRNILYPVTGSFLNPGPYSAYIAMGVCAAFGILKDNNIKKIARGVALITLILGLIILPITNSRASYIAIATILFIEYRNRIKYWTFILPLLGIFAIFLFYLKPASVLARLTMWCITLRSMCNSLLLGHGIGSFPNSFSQESIDFWKYYSDSSLLKDIDVTTNAFNEYLNLGVEQGIIGIGLFLIFIWQVLKNLHDDYPNKYSLLVLLIFALFSYPFHIQPFLILLVIICAYSISKTSPLVVINNIYVQPLIVLTLLFSFNILKGVSNRVNAIKEYTDILSGKSNNRITQYYKLLPLLRDDPNFLFVFAKNLSNHSRYNDSNAILRLGTLVSNDPMFYISMGNNFSKLNFYSEAESCYIYAYRMLPNRLYPLYKLMLLYDYQHQYRKCKVIAVKIIGFKEKVPSKATIEMKHTAKRILSTKL